MKLIRTIVALMLAAFALNLQPAVQDPSSRASAEGVIICGECCPGDNSCWARRRTDFERAYPPRGLITGVCWAQLSKWERDPQSGEQVLRVQRAIYSRVRFDEREVLSTQHHDRNAGFEFEVGQAWSEYLKANEMPQYPARDGMNWGQYCASTSNPRYNEDKNWTRAQGQTTYQRVFLPNYGIADTPEEKAAEARAARERAAREAEQARIAAAEKAKRDAIEAEKRAEAARVEAARKVEAARVEAERQRKIDAMQTQLGGPGKREAAERLAAENEALKALRPKPPAKPPTPCTTRNISASTKHHGQTQAEASARATSAVQRRLLGGLGGSESWVSVAASGAPSCKQEKLLEIFPNPPVGNCFTCISEQMARNLYGWEKGKGYPPPKTEWTCTLAYQGVAKNCPRSASKVSAE